MKKFKTFIIVSKDRTKHVPRFQRGIHAVDTKPLGNTFQTYTSKSKADKSINDLEMYNQNFQTKVPTWLASDFESIEIIFTV
jgi:hypothetical protein